MQALQPLKTPRQIVRLTDNQQTGCGLEITWNDSSRSVLSAETLRRGCPCATCREQTQKKVETKKSSALRVLSATIDQSLDLQSVTAIGRYAIGIRWGDEHDSGIYSFVYLYELANQAS